MVDNHWPDDTSRCHRVLGDLDFDSGNPESARAHYESALKIARSISKRNVLIEALLARGRFLAKHTSEVLGAEVSIAQAFTDLNEALNYAVEGGYRIYEADIRVALGWAWLAHSKQLSVGSEQSSMVSGQSSIVRVKAEAQRALQMSQEMGYHWGKIDAQEVLERIESREQ